MGRFGSVILAAILILGGGPATADDAKIDPAVLRLAAEAPNRDLAVIVTCTAACRDVDDLMAVTPDQELAELGMVAGTVKPAALKALSNLDAVLTIELDSEQSIQTAN